MWNSIVSVPDHCLFIYFPYCMHFVSDSLVFICAVSLCSVLRDGPFDFRGVEWEGGGG